MMREFPFETPKILTIYLQIAQYPILAREIRHRMRQELYKRGVISRRRLYDEARERARISQQRDGLVDPLKQEDEQQWDQRKQYILDYLTDFYFAYNLPLDLIHNIINELLTERSVRSHKLDLPFNPELAPLDLLLAQAQECEALPSDQRAKVTDHLKEIIVVLTRTMISDHLEFMRVAIPWFSAEDFKLIRSRLIGEGKIGGKAAGMMLAWKILQKAAPDIAQQVAVPNSYFIGANVFYDFLSLNHLEYNQKYKSADQIRAEYPQIRAAYEQARFPEPIADRLRDILRELGKTPLIVRSSSLLEDSFGTSFAGKYESHFCPNQGTLKENLRDLTLAIRRIYASVFSPDALFYRHQMGLIDYDERMAILLQEVKGQAYRDYFFPPLAGVAFSYSPTVWSPRLRPEEGSVRLVFGLGTRAVERVSKDYPRLIMLSHPLLRPEKSIKEIQDYSPHFIDLINLATNRRETLPICQMLNGDYPALQFVASQCEGNDVQPIVSRRSGFNPECMVITFDDLLKYTPFASLMKDILKELKEHYHSKVSRF